MHETRQRRLPAFVAECTLGKLSKWLRLAGFDAVYDALPPDYHRLSRFASNQSRFILTRTRRIFSQLDAHHGLLIKSNAPADQVRQVIKYFHIQRRDLKPLSRCLRCNCLLSIADQEIIRGDVPDYIRQHHGRFLTCSSCRRVYWPGTHEVGMLGLISRWFDA